MPAPAGSATLVGSLANDTLTGGVGNDRLFGDSTGQIEAGVAGADNIRGDLPGNGADLLIGDALRFSGTARGGADHLYGNAGNDEVYGDASSAMYGTSRGGNDILYGDDGDDGLRGDAQVMHDSSVGGNDTLYGGGGGDRLFGDAWAGYGSASSGDDKLYGGEGSDALYGDTLEYYGRGAGGNDILEGGAGNDALAGGRGNDVLYGGSGYDIFKFINHGDGNDRFADFQKGQDRFELEGFGLNFGKLDTNRNGTVGAGDAHVRIVNGDLRLDVTSFDTSPIGGSHIVTVDNVTSLSNADFLFLAF